MQKSLIMRVLNVFKNYEDLVKFVSILISKISPKFKYPFALATNLFEMSNNHICLAKHLSKINRNFYSKRGSS